MAPNSRKALVTAVVALFAVGTIALLKDQKAPVDPRPVVTRQVVDYGPLVRQSVARANSQSAQILNQFDDTLGKVSAAHRPKLEAAVNAASREASKYRSVAVMLYYLAWDQVKTEKRTDAYLAELIGPIIDPAFRAFAKDVSTEIARAETDLRRVSVQLAMDLAEIGPGKSPKPRNYQANAEIDRIFGQSLRNLGWSGAAVGVSVAFDSYAIAGSKVGVAAAESLASMGSRTFAKQVAKLVASVAISQSDGPLPGPADILALAGVIWTAYDIHKMRGQFANDIQKTLDAKVDEVRVALSRKSKGLLAQRAREFAKLHIAMGDKALNGMSGTEAR